MDKPAGATIDVTTTEQKVSSEGGCSLQEAIYSDNFDINQTISPTALKTNLPDGRVNRQFELSPKDASG